LKKADNMNIGEKTAGGEEGRRGRRSVDRKQKKLFNMSVSNFRECGAQHAWTCPKC